MSSNDTPKNWLPKPDKSVLLSEPVILMKPATVYNSNDETLDEIEKYYHNVLEHLVGTQVWEILNSLTAVEVEKLKRLNLKQYEQNKVKVENRRKERMERILSEAELLVPAH